MEATVIWGQNGVKEFSWLVWGESERFGVAN